MQSQSWFGEVLTRDSTQEPPPNRPPEPGLGYLCLLLVKFEKKFLSPERRSIALTGRLAGPGRWQAPFFLLVLCIRIIAFKCVNVSPAWPLRFGLFGLFRLENPACQRAPPSSCSVVLDTKKCANKDLCPGEDSRPEEG